MPRAIVTVLLPASFEAPYPKMQNALDTYCWIQERYAKSRNLAEDVEFQRRYNAFYRTGRRPDGWKKKYFGLMESIKREKREFSWILNQLHSGLGRWEASFASKMYATQNPDSAVIDRIVFDRLELRLPYSHHPKRSQVICAQYEALNALFVDALNDESIKRGIKIFRKNFGAPISDTKVLDLLLWQTRPQAGLSC